MVGFNNLYAIFFFCFFAVVFNLFALCLYAGSFDSISYDMIPKWSALYDMELSWSFTIGCVGTCLSLIGSTTSIYMALKYGTNVHITTNVSRVPSLHIHPPPSSRLSSPPRFASPRVSSPLPFSTKKYPSQGTYPKRNITPVHISWIYKNVNKCFVINKNLILLFCFYISQFFLVQRRYFAWINQFKQIFKKSTAVANSFFLTI